MSRETALYDFLRKVFSFLEKPAVQTILIILLGLAVYSNTFDVPFQWDDHSDIENNNLIRDIAALRGVKEFSTHHLRRFITLLTFVADYRLHGLDVAGYHVVNLSIHIACALLLGQLVTLVFMTPFFRTKAGGMSARSTAFLASLLFVCHPVQTEAVTYMVQRLASLAALFYILSIVLYLRWRLNMEDGKTGRSSFLSYFMMLTVSVCAMFTKETAFTMPIIVAACEIMFFDGKPSRRLLFAAPVLLTMAVIPLLSILGAEGIGEATKFHSNIGRMEYFITEFRVIATYLRLLLLPVNQNIDYDYPVLASFADARAVASIFLVLSIMSLSVYLLIRSRTVPWKRLVTFGIVWFFAALSVESGPIPLYNVIFEHRLYLPSAGFFIAASASLNLFFDGTKIGRAAVVFSVLIVIAMSVATYARNEVWRDAVGLWSDVVEKSPGKAGGYNELGLAHMARGGYIEAAACFSRALFVDPRFAAAYVGLGNAFIETAQPELAEEALLKAVEIEPGSVEAHYNLGRAYAMRKKYEQAEAAFVTALRLDPGDEDAKRNLAAVSRLR